MADFSKKSAFGKLFRKKLLYVQHVDDQVDTQSEMDDLFLDKFIINSNFGDPFFIHNFYEERNNPSNLGILRKALNHEIQCVKIYSAPIHLSINCNLFFPWKEAEIHTYVVFRTVDSDGRNNMWWSLEKNNDYIVLRQSTNEAQVINTNIHQERTRPIQLLIESDRGKGSLKHLLKELYTACQIPDPYHVIGSNCQKFASFIFEKANGEGKMWQEPTRRGFTLATISPNGIIYLAIYRFIILPLFRLWNCIKYNIFNRVKNHEIEIDPYAAREYSSANRDVIDEIIKKIKIGNLDIQDDNLKNCPNMSVNRKDDQGYTLLEWAEAFSREDVKNYLIDEKGAVESETFKQNVFFIALQYLNSQDDPKLSFNGVNQNNDTTLHLALYGEKWKIAKTILDRQENINIIATNSLGHTPLHVAVQKKSCPELLEIIKVLLNRMNIKEVNQPDGKGYTSLHWAIYVRSLEKIELLLKKGANVNQSINDAQGLTPLQLAVQRWTDPNNIKKLFKLLSQARDFNIEAKDKRGNTALQTAENENSATKQLLLDSLAEVQHDIANEH
jgi:ankyrin repeat protein